MTIPMANAFMADTWGNCIITSTGVIALSVSQLMSQTIPGIARTTCF